jgi:hypothetical protein
VIWVDRPQWQGQTPATRPSTETYAIVDHEGNCKVVVKLVDNEADAQSMAIDFASGPTCRRGAVPKESADRPGSANRSGGPPRCGLVRTCSNGSSNRRFGSCDEHSQVAAAHAWMAVG